MLCIAPALGRSLCWAGRRRGGAAQLAPPFVWGRSGPGVTQEHCCSVGVCSSCRKPTAAEKGKRLRWRTPAVCAGASWGKQHAAHPAAYLSALVSCVKLCVLGCTLMLGLQLTMLIVRLRVVYTAYGGCTQQAFMPQHLRGVSVCVPARLQQWPSRRCNPAAVPCVALQHCVACLLQPGGAA